MNIEKITMLLKAPVGISPCFLSAFGYHGKRRLVALYWDPSKDKACWKDGHPDTWGFVDHWLFLDLVRSPPIRSWLEENRIHPGNAKEIAWHWLIVDAYTGDLYAADRNEARLILLRQGLPELPSEEECWCRLFLAIPQLRRDIDVSRTCVN